MDAAGSYSVRLRLLETTLALAEEIGFKVPGFRILRAESFPPDLEDTEAITRLLLETTEGLRGEQLLIRPCPRDESLRPELSFAGVFASSLPRRSVPRAEHLAPGLAHVMSERFSAYANYYYQRHGIISERKLDLMINEVIPRSVLFGTAYVYQDRLLTEFYDSPLSGLMRDPVALALRRSSLAVSEHGKMCGVFFELARGLGMPLDIEYVMDVKGDVYITQVRPLSAAHLGNWERQDPVRFQECDGKLPPCVVLNTVGATRGRIVDLRGKPWTDEFTAGSEGDVIFVVEHRPASGISSLGFLEHLCRRNLRRVRLIVDHGESRKMEHLQYMMVEDPGLEFIVQGVGLSRLNGLQHGRTVDIVSDGFSWHLQ